MKCILFKKVFSVVYRMNFPAKQIYNVLVFYSKSAEFDLQVTKLEKKTKKPKPLKTECCEKYKKGKRCKRCPCFDLQADLTGLQDL